MSYGLNFSITWAIENSCWRSDLINLTGHYRKMQLKTLHLICNVNVSQKINALNVIPTLRPRRHTHARLFLSAVTFRINKKKKTSQTLLFSLCRCHMIGFTRAGRQMPCLWTYRLLTSLLTHFRLYCWNNKVPIQFFVKWRRHLISLLMWSSSDDQW